MKKYYPCLITAIVVLCLYPYSALHAKKDNAVTLYATDSLSSATSFNAIRIIDIRSDKANIGRSQMSLARPELKTTDSLSAQLHRVAEAIVRPSSQRGQQELLIIMHNLYLQDVLKDRQPVSTVLIRMDCYLGNNGLYTPAGQIDSLFEIYAPKSTLNVLLYVACDAISQTIKTAATWKSEPAAGKSIATILSVEDDLKQSMPIYNQPPKTGIYYTWEQFVNNTPGDTEFYQDHFQSGGEYINRFYRSSAIKKKEKNLLDTTCFAVYNGKQWFRPYTLNTFKEMKWLDGDFWYYGVSKGLKVDDYNYMFIAGSPYGAIASLLAAGVVYGIKENQKRKPPAYQDAAYQMKLDPVTGKGHKLGRML